MPAVNDGMPDVLDGVPCVRDGMFDVFDGVHGAPLLTLPRNLFF